MERISIRAGRPILPFLFVIFALLGLLASAPIHATGSKSEAQLLRSLFPGATVRTMDPVLGRDTTSGVLTNVSLRGMKGFVPLDEVESRTLSQSLAALAFPIYLHAPDLPQDPLIREAPVAGPSQIKLVQVVFYNRTTGALIGKPSGFPLKGVGWTCAGNACEHVEIVALEPIGDSANAVIFKYVYGISDNRLQVFGFDGAGIRASETYSYGDLGGESGIEASAVFSHWTQADNTVTAAVDYFCPTDEVEFCSSLGLPLGRSSKVLRVLSMH